MPSIHSVWLLNEGWVCWVFLSVKYWVGFFFPHKRWTCLSLFFFNLTKVLKSKRDKEIKIFISLVRLYPAPYCSLKLFDFAVSSEIFFGFLKLSCYLFFLSLCVRSHFQKCLYLINLFICMLNKYWHYINVCATFCIWHLINDLLGIRLTDCAPFASHTHKRTHTGGNKLGHFP